MATIESDIQSLRRDFRGELIRATDAEYDAARRVWNGMIDRRPALIARCVDADDVAALIAYARERALPWRSEAAGTMSPAAPCATAAW
jgi:FAD/FMN-containing dehydrogenase